MYITAFSQLGQPVRRRAAIGQIQGLHFFRMTSSQDAQPDREWSV